eukprot:SAG31_NODE_298_length_18125_cov_27.373350_6_plen_630_part_00
MWGSCKVLISRLVFLAGQLVIFCARSQVSTTNVHNVHPSFFPRRALQYAAASAYCAGGGQCTCGAHSDCQLGEYCSVGGVCAPCAELTKLFDCGASADNSCHTCPKPCCKLDQLMAQCSVLSWGDGQACFSSTSAVARNTDLPTCLASVGACGCGCQIDGIAVARPICANSNSSRSCRALHLAQYSTPVKVVAPARCWQPLSIPAAQDDDMPVRNGQDAADAGNSISVERTQMVQIINGTLRLEPALITDITAHDVEVALELTFSPQSRCSVQVASLRNPGAIVMLDSSALRSRQDSRAQDVQRCSSASVDQIICSAGRSTSDRYCTAIFEISSSVERPELSAASLSALSETLEEALLSLLNIGELSGLRIRLIEVTSYMYVDLIVMSILPPDLYANRSTTATAKWLESRLPSHMAADQHVANATCSVESNFVQLSYARVVDVPSALIDDDADATRTAKVVILIFTASIVCSLCCLSYIRELAHPSYLAAEDAGCMTICARRPGCIGFLRTLVEPIVQIFLICGYGCEKLCPTEDGRPRRPSGRQQGTTANMGDGAVQGRVISAMTVASEPDQQTSQGSRRTRHRSLRVLDIELEYHSRDTLEHGRISPGTSAASTRSLVNEDVDVIMP